MSVLRFKEIAVFIVVMVVVAGLVEYANAPRAEAQAIQECADTRATHDERLECWMGLVREKLRSKGMAEAMHTFRAIYDSQPTFANSGCHRHAHRVGDMVYYEIYLPLGDVRAIEFPPETTSCGFGFFHGFVEHYVQDAPTTEAITELCEYLDVTLTPSMGDIRMTCYHGAGHGLALAQAERVPRAEWGDVASFVDAPLAICEQLPLADPTDLGQCQEGVFNVLVDWMELEEYGFVYDTANPFRVCEAQPAARQFPCYYEMAMKLDKLSNWDPRGVAQIVDGIDSDRFRMTAFKVGIAGLVQHIVADGKHGELFDACAELSAEYTKACASAIVGGLFEHGQPRQEYIAAKDFCSSAPVVSRGADSACWENYMSRARRYYDIETARQLCAAMPSERRSPCLKFVEQR